MLWGRKQPDMKAWGRPEKDKTVMDTMVMDKMGSCRACHTGHWRQRRRRERHKWKPADCIIPEWQDWTIWFGSPQNQLNFTFVKIALLYLHVVVVIVQMRLMLFDTASASFIPESFRLSRRASFARRRAGFRSPSMRLCTAWSIIGGIVERLFWHISPEFRALHGRRPSRRRREKVPLCRPGSRDVRARCTILPSILIKSRFTILAHGPI